MTTTLHGSCHCGAITVAFETSDPRSLPLRACQCSFCRRHGGVTTSDPAGRLVVDVHQPGLLQRYRFALGITDFLICRTCGVYVAAVMEDGAGSLGVLNINVLDDRDRISLKAEPKSYEGENVSDRLARRRKAWMPVEVAPRASVRA